MARGRNSRRRHVSQCRQAPYKVPSCNKKTEEKEVNKGKKCSKPSVKKVEEDVVCPVCMEWPHNAVLLVCSSHDKGCRPYICSTNYRYSNCLDRYVEAYGSLTKSLCPLCRGQVKNYSVDLHTRQVLDNYKRSCAQDECSFVGNYRELREHMRVVHPFPQLREVDPAMAEKWKNMVNESDWDDMMTMITSSMPGTTVVGDYIVDSDYRRYLGSVVPSIPPLRILMQEFEASESVSLNARLRRLQHQGPSHNIVQALSEESPSSSREGGGTSTDGSHPCTSAMLGMSGGRRRYRGN